MKADRRLWIDDKEQLTDTPPSRGILIAAKGADIFPRHIEAYNLSVIDGRVCQGGKPARSPKSSPDRLVAHRDLFITKEGELRVKPPGDRGFKIADKGDKIQIEYVQNYGLLVNEKGEVVQKKTPKAPNKQREAAPNKGGLSIPKDGVTHTSGDA